MSKKTVLITGASRGIGKTLAIEFAKNGYYVLINYKTDEANAHDTLDVILKEGGEGNVIQFDVTIEESVENAIEQWKKLHPERSISILINNAGIRKDNLMLFQSLEDWKSVLSTNLDGFFNVTKVVLKDMIYKKHGRIINITSLSGLKGMAGQTNYAASKGGLVAATKSLALEVARKNITVNAVAPGFIKTDMTKDLDENELKKLIPVQRFGEPSEVASLVLYLASESASYITGEVISINGGLYT
jgi:3-oxoacyl-[acyl-carrier protein] reductase